MRFPPSSKTTTGTACVRTCSCRIHEGVFVARASASVFSNRSGSRSEKMTFFIPEDTVPLSTLGPARSTSAGSSLLLTRDVFGRNVLIPSCVRKNGRDAFDPQYAVGGENV